MQERNRDYSGLEYATAALLALCVLVFMINLWLGFLASADPQTIQDGVVRIAWGFAILLGGMLVKGLTRLAVNVASHIHGQAVPATVTLASEAATLEETRVDAKKHPRPPARVDALL